MIDTLTKVLINAIDTLGFAVQVSAAQGLVVVVAVCHRTNEIYIVRGPDMYTVVVELAEQVGMDLMDG